MRKLSRTSREGEEEEIEKKKPTTVVGAFSDVFYLNILMNGQQIQFLGFHNVCCREKGTDNNAPMRLWLLRTEIPKISSWKADIFDD